MIKFETTPFIPELHRPQLPLVKNAFMTQMTSLAVLGREVHGSDDAEPREETVKRPEETDISPVTQLNSLVILRLETKTKQTRPNNNKSSREASTK